MGDRPMPAAAAGPPPAAIDGGGTGGAGEGGPTVRDLRRRLAAALAAAGMDTPELDARLLAAAALGCAPAELITRDAHAVPAPAGAVAGAFLARRLAGEPVARILGRREFWSLDLSLSPDTLVPRPDTETVVEAALAACPDRAAPLRILDLGTGSGAILAALLAERPAACGVGVDRAEGAARTARDNLAQTGVGSRAGVVVGDWGAALGCRFDLVVSNPPYIPRGALAGLAPEVRRFDPVLALDGGDDGLDAYRAIAAALPRLLVPGGVAVLELGAGQEADVAGLLRAAGLEVPAAARRDLGGIGRALIARRPHP